MAFLVLNRPRSISASEVADLANADRLPAPPPSREFGLRRLPTFAELNAYEWFAVERGELITGIMAVRVVYYLHWNADALSVEHLAGSPRACSDLIDWVGHLERERGLPAIAAIDIEHKALLRFVARKRYFPARVLFTGPHG